VISEIDYHFKSTKQFAGR